MILSYKIKEKGLSDVKNKWVSLGIVLLIISIITLAFTCLFEYLTIDLRQEILRIENAILEIDPKESDAQTKINMYMQNLLSATAALEIYSLIEVAGKINAGIFMVSVANVFLSIAKGGEFENKDVRKIFSRIKEGFILNILITVRVFLWSLLFIIPGIVKYFSYSMAGYIKAEHPEYGYNQAIQESEKLMNGFKGHYFSFLISFIGWFILNTLIGTLIWRFCPSNNAFLILGNFLVMIFYIPLDIYLRASKANYYLELKEERKRFDEFLKSRNSQFNPFTNFGMGQNQNNNQNNTPFDNFSDKTEQKEKKDDDPFSGF